MGHGRIPAYFLSKHGWYWSLSLFEAGKSFILGIMDLCTIDGHNKVKGLSLSFQTAVRLCNLTEILLKMPSWKCHVIDTAPHQTKSCARLFYQDTVECLKMLLSNLLFGNFIDFSPYHMFTNAQCLIQIYSKWMSGNCHIPYDWPSQLWHSSPLLTPLETNSGMFSPRTHFWTSKHVLGSPLVILHFGYPLLY